MTACYIALHLTWVLLAVLIYMVSLADGPRRRAAAAKRKKDSQIALRALDAEVRKRCLQFVGDYAASASDVPHRSDELAAMLRRAAREGRRRAAYRVLA